MYFLIYSSKIQKNPHYTFIKSIKKSEQASEKVTFNPQNNKIIKNLNLIILISFKFTNDLVFDCYKGI